MSLTTTIRASILLTALTGFIPVAHAQTPITIDFPGALTTTLGGINDSGQISGSYTGSNNSGYGFSLNSEAFSSISGPGALATSAGGISDSGQIVGSYDVPSFVTGFIDNGGAFTGLVVPYDTNTEAIGISSDGNYVVGAYRVGIYGYTSGVNRGFLYTGGAFTPIDYPGAIATVATGVNRTGTIVGRYVDSGGNMHGFVDNGGVYTSLDFPSAASSAATGINDSGTIVGGYGTTIYFRYFDEYILEGNHGFVYSGGVFNSVDMPTGSTAGGLAGINNNGAIVGSYTDAAKHTHGVLYPAGIQGYVNPKYLIMGLTYAPPGGSASSVSYQDGGVVGNTTTITKSFTNGVTTTDSISGGVGIPKADGGEITETVSTGWMQKTSTSNAVTVTKTSSTTFKTPGVPNVYSPVDHDYDIVWLWLNPVAVFTLPNTNTGGPVIWIGYGYDDKDPLHEIDVWPIYVGYLNGDFGPLSAQDADALSRSWVTTQNFGPGQGPGITSADFPNILKADPFANNPYDANSGYILSLAPNTAPATSADGRFTEATPANGSPESIDYAQAPLDSTQAIQTTYQSAISTTTTSTQTSDTTYTVGFGVEEMISETFLIFTDSADFKTNWNLTWENISQTQNINTSSQTDTAVIAPPPCPATTPPCNPEYTEPRAFAIYQDNLYGTFMFWPNPYFSITKVAPATNTVAAGSAASYTISTLASAGYSEPSISFNVTGLPAGASFNQGTVEPGSPFTLTITTTSASPVGSFPLTITATDGSLSYIAYATLVVTAPVPPGFTLSSSPMSVSIAQNGSGTTTISVSDMGGFAGTVALAASGLPSGVFANFAAGTAAGTQVLTLTANSTVAVGGPATVTITGTAGNLTSFTTVALSITAEAAFGPSGASGSDAAITVKAGATTGNTSIISVAGTNGYSGTVNLSCSISPTAASDPATCSLSPASVTLSGGTPQTSTLTVTTTAASTAENRMQRLLWPAAGGTALGLVLLIRIPRRRRHWFAMLGLLTLFTLVSAIGCGGGGSAGGGGRANSGTSVGTYTVTVTGTGTSSASSSSVTATVGTVTLTVN